ncbi:MAG TPA: DJ-1/PfpI family protein [Thermomicrobiales bacterium]|nr:DJ-1/PfpI family protein [Thermomicrobiales bacterium]
MSKTQVGIVIFDQVEVLDFCGPFEVFSVATKPGLETYPETALYDVHLIAETLDPIRTIGGMRVLPSCTFADHPPFAIIVVPGGYGTRRLEQADSPLVQWIQNQAECVPLVTSVCTGAFLLAKAGLLAGLPATTHWANIESLRERYLDLAVTSTERVVDTGKIITSAGISAGIDMALHVVARQHGNAAAVQTARDMEYVSALTQSLESDS